MGEKGDNEKQHGNYKQKKDSNLRKGILYVVLNGFGQGASRIREEILGMEGILGFLEKSLWCLGFRFFWGWVRGGGGGHFSSIRSLAKNALQRGPMRMPKAYKNRPLQDPRNRV